MSNRPRVSRLAENSPDLPRARVFGAAALIVAVGALAYANSFSGALVFDDVPAIPDNPTIRTLWPPSVPFSPPANSGVGGRPLANFSFAVNHALGGTHVRGYHAGNLLLHLGSALLLFGIVRRTLRRQAASTSCGLAAALLWVVHPLTTAAVTWISQRTELLMGFFYLLTLYAFIRGAAEMRGGWLAGSVLACAAGMMSKEVMMTAPVLVLLYDRTFVAGSFRAAWSARRRYYLALAATWLVLGYLLTTGLSQRSVGFGLGVSPLDYAATELRAVLRYLKLAIWPWPLVFDYGAIFDARPGVTLSCLAVVGALLGWTFAGVRRGSALGFAAACFFLLLAPTSTFVPVAQQPIAENRMYLPLAALIVAAMAGARRVWPASTWGRRGGGVGFALTAAACAAFALLTFARNETYRSELTLWSDTVRKRPQNPRAHYNLGVALLDPARAEEARAHFERAIQQDAREPRYHNSLGNAWLELGRPKDALPHFAEAVRRDPRYARAWYNYGTALLRAGDATAAIERLGRALALAPPNAETLHALGNAHFQLDQPGRALPHYQAALRLDPTLADAHYSAGSACLELARFDDAVTHFAAAAQLKPRDPEIRNNHGAALLRAGRAREAIAEFEHALRLKPDYGDARDNLAVARAALRSTP